MLLGPLIKLNKLLYFYNLRIYMFLYKWSSQTLRRYSPRGSSKLKSQLEDPSRMTKSKSRDSSPLFGMTDWNDIAEQEFSVRILDSEKMRKPE